MVFPRSNALISPLLLALSLGTSTAGAQRLAPSGVRPRAHSSLTITISATAHAPGVRGGPGSAVLLTAAAPTDQALVASGAYDLPALDRGHPSLWKHLVVGTLAGATTGFGVSYVAYGLSCEGDACAWMGLGVMASTGLGAGAGLLAGGAVYLWKRARQ